MAKPRYYILEPLQEEVEQYLKEKLKLKYVASDLAENPEGYLIYTSSEDVINQMREFGDKIHVHDVPDSITEQYEQYDGHDEFITDYWDGNILLKEGIVMRG